jgi:hypothetical protein
VAGDDAAAEAVLPQDSRESWGFFVGPTAV